MTPSIPVEPSAVIDSRNHSRNYGLDLFRFVAISLVIVSHFVGSFKILGAFGVELFFALSGFLIGGIFWKQMKAAPNFGFRELKLFLHRRWMRTLPNYYLFFFANLLLVPIFLKLNFIQSDLQGFSATQIGSYLVFLQNFAWPISSFYAVSWSLAIEEWFYLVFPFAVLLVFRLTGSRKTAFISVIAAMMLLPFLARLLSDPLINWNSGIRTVVAFRLDALMFGVSLALIKIERAHWWPMLRRAFLPAVIACAGLLWFMRHIPKSGHPLTIALLFTFLPFSCALLIPWIETLARPRGPIPRWIENISQWSYSIYLSHIPILFTVYYLTASLQLGSAGKLAVKVVALSCVIAASALIYNYFEKPFMARRRRA